MEYIVAVGSSFDGWDFYGPFVDEDDAMNYAASNFENWNVIQLLEP